MRQRCAALLAALVAAACGPDPGTRTLVPLTAARPPALAPPVQVGPDTVRVLRGGEPAAQLIVGLIDASQRHVQVEMYELGREDIAAALVRARTRGVPVTVIDDSSVDVTLATAIRLRAAGIEVIDYPVRKLMIDHVKLLIVDSQVAVVGGINWGISSFANHDFDAELQGPVVANLARIYARDLITCGRRVRLPEAVPDPAMIVASTLPAADIRPLALDVVERSRHRLDLALFVITDAGIVHAVERAASRGVAVRVLLDPGQRPSDASEAELLAAGVPVRRYRSHGEKLHAKVAVADGRTVIFGSANWSSGGFARNHEVDVEIPDAPEIAAEFEAQINLDWTNSATPGP